MKDYTSGNLFDDFFDDLDVRQEARRFEQSIQNNEYYYMDLTTIQELYEYYRIMDKSDSAIELLNYALEQFPYSADLYYKKSILESELENYEDAYLNIELALQAQPDYIDYLLQKARVLSLQSQYADAQNILLTTLEFSDEPAEIYFELGVLAESMSNYPQAIEYFQASVQADPNMIDALTETITCYEQLGETEKALALCDKYVHDYPFSAQGWYLFGTVYYKAGFFENAIWAFDYSLAINEDFLVAYHGKGNSLIELYKYDEAIRVFLELLVRFPFDEAGLLSLADCYFSIEDYRQAHQYYRRCEKLFPDCADAFLGQAEVCKVQQKYLLAVRYYQKALACVEDLREAWLGMAEAEYELGNYVSAHEALVEAIRLGPDDVKMWQDWAHRLEQDQKLEEALTFLENGICINPGQMILYYQYAVYAFRAGRSREAYMYLENALISDYHKHRLIYQMSPELSALRPIQELIEQYRPR